MAEPSRSLSPSTRTHCNVHSFDTPVTYGLFLSFCTSRLVSDAWGVDVGIFKPQHHSCGAGAKRIPRHGSTPCRPSVPVLPGPHTPWTLCRVALALRARPVQKTSRAAVYLTERVSRARAGEAGMGGGACVHHHRRHQYGGRGRSSRMGARTQLLRRGRTRLRTLRTVRTGNMWGTLRLSTLALWGYVRSHGVCVAAAMEAHSSLVLELHR